MSRIIGAHSMIHSANPDADRDFLRFVLKLTNVDAGGGFLIFGLPAAEVHVHPCDKNDVHELYLMCDDVEAFVEEMKENNVSCGPIQDQGWGVLTQVTLPGGGRLGVYQPRHVRPGDISQPATEADLQSREAAIKGAVQQARTTAVYSSR